MSVLFSLEPDCLGLHEEAATNHDWFTHVSELVDKWPFVAECSTYGFIGKASREESAKVYIRKNAEDSRKECVERFGFDIPDQGFDALLAVAEEWAEREGALIIEGYKLWKVDTLRLIWEHCFNGERPFPEEKVRRLVTLNIQRHEPHKVFTVETGQRLMKELL